MAHAGLHETVLIGDGDCLRPAAGAQLPEDVLDVRPDRLGADEQGIGDLPLLEPIGEQAEDLPFSGRQGRHDRRLA